MKKRILFITDKLHSKYGGVPTAILNISKLFFASNISFDILNIGEKIEIEGLEIINFPASGIPKFQYSKSGEQWLKQNFENYNVFYFHSVWSLSIIRLYQIILKFNLTYYISSHGCLDPFDIQKKKPLKKLLGKLIVNRILTSAKHIITTSTIEKEKLNYFGIKKDNAIVLPLPVDYEEGILGSGDCFRNKYRIDNQFIFLFLSRINYKKGLDLFILSVAELINQNKIDISSFKIVIAGDFNNHYTNYIKSLILKNQLSKNVIFTGNIEGNEKANAYAAADVFILPSHNENFGLAIVEALQSGLPILISKNVYIYKELFNSVNNHPGWICNENITDLKEMVLSCYLNAREKQYSENALEISKQFLSKNIQFNYIEVFNGE
jgi:glycosyltransferase involved in cell wall biosynthesis